MENRRVSSEPSLPNYGINPTAAERPRVMRALSGQELMADELKLSLLENAEDFLREAVKYAKVSSPRDWKYAALHLWSALELLLKALLETEHWSLLFEDVNKASRKKLEEGDFQTVRFDTALERIGGIVGISILDRDLRYLRQLRDLRNRMTHSAVQTEC